jgi:hypothetical protein
MIVISELAFEGKRDTDSREMRRSREILGEWTRWDLNI